MADIYIDVDVAQTELPVNLMPLVDDTDGVTIEDAVAYNAAGMDLNWNFITSAGSFTQTNVVPTTAGVHDWTHQGNGIYTLEVPASAGTINNDTEGYGWFSGVATGVAPWRSPVYCFRAAAINDALCDGGDILDVNTTQVGGTTQTANDVGADVQTMVNGIITGTAQTGTLSTTQASTDLTGYADDELIGRVVVWISGTADGQASKITDYANTNGVLTFVSMATAPVNGDTFKIV